MLNTEQKFSQQARQYIADVAMQGRLKYSISKYEEKHHQGKLQFADLDLARSRAGAIKNRVIENLEKYLLEFESNFLKNGGKIIWAVDAEEALREVERILKQHEVKTAVKTKSMISEELGLNELLSKLQIQCPETDLGEFIQQEAGEKPFHIVTPAMHKSKEEIADLFAKKYKLQATASPEQIMAFCRNYLREKFYEADAGITGANFLIADAGAIAITENEGNGVLTTAFPKIQITLAGIEKIIPSLQDLDLFWPLLATYGTGQRMTTYNTVITGSRRNETAGPEEMYLVLVDNGRSDLLAQTEQRRALACIRCGACLNACPVYNIIGGHTYNTTYQGPIGKVISPWMKGFPEFKHLSQASSLCGKCTEVCPVKIDIHRLIIYNREAAVNKGLQRYSEKMAWYFWRNAMLSRKNMNKGGAKVKNLVIQTFFKRVWGTDRELPQVAERSFNQRMREKFRNSGSPK